jgi:hypothetical protein
MKENPMNTQLNTHAVCETVAAPFGPQPILPAVIEQTARKVFESFSEKMKAALNGREDRALKLALDGHVTHKSARIFSVRSENGEHSYLVNLDKSFCNCPDSTKEQVCKHRLAAYLVEQSMQANHQLAHQPEEQMTPQEETIEKVRLTLHARSEHLREAIIYAKLPMEHDLLPVEIIDLQGEVALVRALPCIIDDEIRPYFAFPGRKASAQVLAKSLVEVKIYR